jgi:hypothetical protein
VNMIWRLRNINSNVNLIAFSTIDYLKLKH